MMGEDKAKWPDVDGLIQAVEAGFVVENDVIYDAREAFTELVRGFTANVALFRDGWAAAQVAADNAPYRPGISVCFNCGPVDVCDEDKCCVSCGRDLIDVQGDVSVDVLTDAADELRAERDAAVARAEAAEAAWRPIATAPKDGSRLLLWLPELQLNYAPPRIIPALAAEGFFDTLFDHEWMLSRGGVSIDYRPLVPTHWMPLPTGPRAG